MEMRKNQVDCSAVWTLRSRGSLRGICSMLLCILCIRSCHYTGHHIQLIPCRLDPTPPHSCTPHIHHQYVHPIRIQNAQSMKCKRPINPNTLPPLKKPTSPPPTPQPPQPHSPPSQQPTAQSTPPQSSYPSSTHSPAPPQASPPA